MGANLPDRSAEPRDPDRGTLASAVSHAVIGMTFEKARVVVSGRRFERCTFIGCELVFDGRPVHLVDNAFRSCAWTFEGAAGVTLDLLAALCRDDPALRATVARELGLTCESTAPG